MSDELVGAVLEGSSLTIDQVCAVCAIEQEWIVRHVEEGLLSVSGTRTVDIEFLSVKDIAHAKYFVC